jgi:hypothetical protein
MYIHLYFQYSLAIIEATKETAIYTVPFTVEDVLLYPHEATNPGVNIQTTHASIGLSIAKALNDRQLSIVYFPIVLSSSKMNGYLSY